jgi:translation elongation factor EF-G
VSGDKNLTVDLKADGLPPREFASAAATVLSGNERVEVEATETGLVLRGVWEWDVECAIEELTEALGVPIETRQPEILYRKETRLLEPVMKIRLTVPEDCIGDVIGDLSRRRGEIQDVRGGDDGYCRIDGIAPLANLFGYHNAVQQLAKGTAKLDIDFLGYQPVPPIGPEPNPNEPAAAALRARRAA